MGPKDWKQTIFIDVNSTQDVMCWDQDIYVIFLSAYVDLCVVVCCVTGLCALLYGYVDMLVTVFSVQHHIGDCMEDNTVCYMIMEMMVMAINLVSK